MGKREDEDLGIHERSEMDEWTFVDDWKYEEMPKDARCAAVVMMPHWFFVRLLAMCVQACMDPEAVKPEPDENNGTTYFDFAAGVVVDCFDDGDVLHNEEIVWRGLRAEDHTHFHLNDN